MSHSCSPEDFVRTLSCCSKIRSVLASIGGASVPGIRTYVTIPADVFKTLTAFRKKFVSEYPFLKDPNIVLFPRAFNAEAGNKSFSMHLEIPVFEEKPKPVEPKKFDLTDLFGKE